MPVPKRMPWRTRWDLIRRIFFGRLNVIGKVNTELLYEVTLRNRSKEWYKNRDEGRYPFLEPDDDILVDQ